MSAIRGQKRTRLKSSRSEANGGLISSPPVKRPKTIPDDQLKLERVLKAAAKDATILQQRTPSKQKSPSTSHEKRRTRSRPVPNDKSSPKPDGETKDTGKKRPAVLKKKASPSQIEGEIGETKDSKLKTLKRNKSTTKKEVPSASKKLNTPENANSKYFAEEKNVTQQNIVSNTLNGKKSSQGNLSKPKRLEKDKEKGVDGPKSRKRTEIKTSNVKELQKEKQVAAPSRKRVSRSKNLKETKITPKKIIKHENIPSPSKPLLKMEMDEDSDSEESDWEEVEDLGGDAASPEKSQLPEEPVTITLQEPNLMTKKKKKEFDMEAYIRRQINRAEREIQLEMHKVHLLCLLSHGFHRNRLCNDPDLLALGLSVYPFHLIDREVLFWDTSVMTKVAKWFSSTFTIAPDLKEEFRDMKRTLTKRFSSRTVASEPELVLLFLIILRSVGVVARLVFSLQPVSHKCTRLLKARKNKDSSSEIGDLSGSDKTEKKETKTSKSKTKDSVSMAKSKAKNTKPRSSASKVSYIDISDDETGPSKKKKRKSPETIQVSSDSDFEAETSTLRKSPSVTRKKSGKKEKIVSSDSDDIEVTRVTSKERGSDMWLEVYMERAEGWIPLDPVRCKVNRPSESESRATQPVYYVLAYDADNCVKDVTPRYASGWLSHTRKLRVDNEWWDDVLKPYTPRNKARLEAEDVRLQTQQLKKPLPTSVTEYKNHPLFALKRHLLKFEGIYPPDAVPVGFVKGEPVYDRNNVHMLHTKETWLKEGRAVRVKEKPYKLVKARKKKSRKSYEIPVGGAEDEKAECFGHWQTEQYMPPPVFNGKIPRNDYGNLELFKPWMIPPGGVHLRLPGLNRIAKKMKMDCVPAMVGWDQHCGFSHPVLDGFIVCEEHKDILIAAWDEQQEIDKEREQEKREKRVLANWKLLTRGLVIKERMKIRFQLQEAYKPSESNSKGKDGGDVEDAGQKATDMAHAWPMNRPETANQLSTTKDKTLFPTEEL